MSRTTWASTWIAAALVVSASFASPAQAIVRGKPVHGIALYGEPKYGPNEVFDFVNPDAPKGGILRQNVIGTFDSLNPFVIKGNPAAGLTALGAGSYFPFIEPIMVRGANEPGAYYCLMCETVEVGTDGTWVEFVIRSEAKFHDGTPVTPDDVVFSFNTLMEKGSPLYKLYWGDVTKAEKTGPRKVRFTFKSAENTELPALMGELPVLSKAFWTKNDLSSTTLEVPVSTGPYKIESFEPGRFIVYKRDPHYWGRNLVITKGAYNFDQIRYEYYRDEDVAFEAFKAYQYDLRAENMISRWAVSYDKTQVDTGLVIKGEFKDGEPARPQVFVMNLRRTKFADIRVRKALGLAFDFDASNKTLAYGLVSPVTSYFMNSELASSGLPHGKELEILEKYRGKVPDEVFTKPFSPPRTDGTGNIRDNLLTARNLLLEAGWAVKDSVLTNSKTGEKFEFEFLTPQAAQEKWINPYFRNLERLGIKGVLRVVDTTQYANRVNEFDFDMIIGGPGQSASPGNEQRELWGSASADRKGSRNWAGIKNPVVDDIIEKLIVAPTREDLVAHVRALDRVLLWNHYFVHEFSLVANWLAYWNKFGMPKTPLSGPQLFTWWLDAAKAAEVDTKRGSGERGK
jgi:microcin C transport system substrate-binding protein